MRGGGHLHHISSSLNFRTLNLGNFLELWHYCSRENLLKCQRYGFNRLIKTMGLCDWNDYQLMSFLFCIMSQICNDICSSIGVGHDHLE